MEPDRRQPGAVTSRKGSRTRIATAAQTSEFCETLRAPAVRRSHTAAPGRTGSSSRPSRTGASARACYAMGRCLPGRITRMLEARRTTPLLCDAPVRYRDLFRHMTMQAAGTARVRSATMRMLPSGSRGHHSPATQPTRVASHMPPQAPRGRHRRSPTASSLLPAQSREERRFRPARTALPIRLPSYRPEGCTLDTHTRPWGTRRRPQTGGQPPDPRRRGIGARGGLPHPKSTRGSGACPARVVNRPTVRGWSSS